ncbi:nitrile hydratase subunit alpha [Rhizobium leguminosarum]|uniref:nitrile hydratase subunit alpha n=1 Tax=Rhizobium leguminosarum TaxID=384 RepID=UPI000DDC7A30|nr:nitrile hydratase subunit alpha [Rhizobium leguminosarum]RWX22847.1 NHLP leader peptide family natural product precursor [Rhizobium leguminosarum]
MASGEDEKRRMQANEKAWSEAVARVWLGDDAFKAQLIADPRATLESLGANLPSSAKISVKEDGSDELTFVLPRRPVGLGQLSAGDVVELYGTCPCTVCAVPTNKI